jgi:hypothetical protein
MSSHVMTIASMHDRSQPQANRAAFRAAYGYDLAQ